MLDTNEIIRIALDLVNMKELPEDSAVYVSGDKIKKILYGIDIGVSELLFAKEHGYDCVISHHPVGLVNHWKVFWRHLNQLISNGVKEKEAEEIIQKKIIGFKINAHAMNYDLIPSFARLIKIPFLNVHCPSDELGRQLITKSIKGIADNNYDITLLEVKAHLKESFKEFKIAQTDIEILKGDEKDLLGKWIFSHGAFTNGGYDIANCYYKYGLDTVIYIHIAPEELFKILKISKGNFVITGHIASDSIGINPFLNNLEAHGLEITSIGGLLRVNKND